jgi:hypothetical protein
MMNRRLKDQLQVALIWMRDVNMARAERTPQGMLTRLASHETAEYHLNRYFEMIETQLAGLVR